jgi:hypothetical protein
MAWYEGTLTQAAGDLIAILDAKLPLNGYWSIFDASAGVNCKVYRNYKSADYNDYYVKVDDNYANYAIVELWEGWNGVGHAGVGNSLATIGGLAMRINKKNGGYAISVLDNRFVYVDTYDYIGTYIGQLNRFDATKNMPIYIGELTGAQKYNVLGAYNFGSSNGGWACLFDEGGTSRVLNPYGYSSAYLYMKTISGQFVILETLVYNNTTYLLLGQLEGVTTHGTGPSSFLSNGDVVTKSGVDWLVCGGGYSSKMWSFIRMS